MSRRRFVVVCSSDEEEDYPPPSQPQPPPPAQQLEEDIDDLISDGIETDFRTVTLNSTNPTLNNNNCPTATNTRRYNHHIEPIPLDISDDDQENINIDDRTNNSSSDGNNSNFEVSQSPIHGVLERLGLRVRREWLDSCLQGLQLSVQGFERMDDSAKAKLCFAQFLWSDMNYCGAGVLPLNLHTLHMVDLKGPFVLQVDEIVNISKPLRERYKNAAPPGSKRCLKLSMTDGAQRVFGMEYRPIKDLEVAPAGLKVVVCNVNVRHGLMMLVPENIEVLGGNVEVLEAARQRLVNEINKPARGKRIRTGVVPPLAARATNAAWPPSNDAARPPSNDAAQPPSNDAARPPSNDAARPPSNYAAPGHVDRTAPVNTTSAQSSGQGSSCPQEQAEVPRHTDLPTIIERQGPNSFRRDFEVPVSRSNTESTSFSSVQTLESVTIQQHIDEPRTEVMAPSGGDRLDNGDNGVPNTSSMDVDDEEMSMLDDLEQHFILRKDNETPFTYLASLSAKFSANDDETSVVRGKIKCFLTGVKGFQFKQRESYELQVYVDDGSLISEIFIDHSVVQNRIGYSPQEVTNALASSESKCVSEMKEIMKKFQIFLINFEGTMIIEMSKASGVPVAVEMKQGCPASETRLLFNRVKSFISANPQNSSNMNPIQLSP
ncbi:hypothetical protein ACS0TY_034832 [Phlomoides rotata]